jgi:hypothetical protein
VLSAMSTNQHGKIKLKNKREKIEKQNTKYKNYGKLKEMDP